MDVDVVIIGSGFGGLAMAIEVSRRKLGSYVILEKESALGGTWRDNTYPGAACDVKATLYHYSFAPWTWSRAYPQQDEILRYVRSTADTFGVTPHVHLEKEVQEAKWVDADRRWVVRCADGSTYRARYLVSATGQLNRPNVPALEGAETFKGPQFHTARWRHDVDLTGKSVAVVGSGASAIQVVPAIADQVGQLTVFQRSAPYVMPKEDVATTSKEQWRQRTLPWLTLPSRLRAYAFGELFGAGLVGKANVRARARQQWEQYANAVVRDPELRAKVEPDYEIGCKRVLLASDWYSTLQKDNVELVTDAIVKLRPSGIETTGKKLHKFDVIIYATGFHATEFLAPITIKGRNRKVLGTLWSKRPLAHRGVTVPDFPNFFVLYGPNTNLGSNSILFMLESQVNYVAHLMRAAKDRRWESIEVRPEALAAWRALIDDESPATAWVQGCTSWYTKDGVNTNNWPKSSWQYHQLLRRVDFANYEGVSA